MKILKFRILAAWQGGFSMFTGIGMTSKQRVCVVFI